MFHIKSGTWKETLVGTTDYNQQHQKLIKIGKDRKENCGGIAYLELGSSKASVSDPATPSELVFLAGKFIKYQIEIQQIVMSH